MRLDLGDGHDETATVSVGEPLEITIVAPGGTGYDWYLSIDEARWRRVSRHVAPNLDGFGASATAEFVVVPLAEGRSELVLRLVAPWRREPAREHRLVIDAEATAR